jgi:two-component system sensor histidine kinase DesK
MGISSQRLAIAVAITISLGYPLIGVVMIIKSGSPVVVAVTLIALVAFFLPHFLHLRTALRGETARGFPWWLLMQGVATYVPILWLTYAWAAPMAPILAGAVLLRLRAGRATGVVVVMTAYQVWWSSALGGLAVGIYYGITVFITGFVVFVVVRLVTVTRELEKARSELAETAVLKERLRISRDLHDGLGRSLTAIALKGDLARRLLDRDPEAAAGELTELAQVARDAAQDVRQVARGYREMSLVQEVHRAVALLEASGVTCQADLATVDLPRPVEETLAWAVREGVTNVVRHSRATTCSITTSHTKRAIRLELTNDGVPEPATEYESTTTRNGNGLTGLAERAGQHGGTLDAGRTGGEVFRLVMELPASGIAAGRMAPASEIPAAPEIITPQTTPETTPDPGPGVATGIATGQEVPAP